MHLVQKPIHKPNLQKESHMNQQRGGTDIRRSNAAQNAMISKALTLSIVNALAHSTKTTVEVKVAGGVNAPDSTTDQKRNLLEPCPFYAISSDHPDAIFVLDRTKDSKKDSFMQLNLTFEDLLSLVLTEAPTNNVKVTANRISGRTETGTSNGSQASSKSIQTIVASTSASRPTVQINVADGVKPLVPATINGHVLEDQPAPWYTTSKEGNYILSGHKDPSKDAFQGIPFSFETRLSLLVNMGRMHGVEITVNRNGNRN